jgi:hypothetical protein
MQATTVFYTSSLLLRYIHGRATPRPRQSNPNQVSFLFLARSQFLATRCLHSHLLAAAPNHKHKQHSRDQSAISRRIFEIKEKSIPQLAALVLEEISNFSRHYLFQILKQPIQLFFGCQAACCPGEGVGCWVLLP